MKKQKRPSPLSRLMEYAGGYKMRTAKRSIQQSLSRLIKNKTVIIIAHRMRTVAGADKIVVIKDGKSNEQGTPEDLLKQDGEYAKMVRLQQQSSDRKMA